MKDECIESYRSAYCAEKELRRVKKENARLRSELNRLQKRAGGGGAVDVDNDDDVDDLPLGADCTDYLPKASAASDPYDPCLGYRRNFRPNDNDEPGPAGGGRRQSRGKQSKQCEEYRTTRPGCTKNPYDDSFDYDDNGRSRGPIAGAGSLPTGEFGGGGPTTDGVDRDTGIDTNAGPKYPLYPINQRRRTTNGREGNRRNSLTPPAAAPSMETKSYTVRLIGEIAFQLERRILNKVFCPMQSGVQTTRRYYGYAVLNLSDMIDAECRELGTGALLARKEAGIKTRFNTLKRKLRIFGYDWGFHPQFSARMINKYGILRDVEGQAQALDDGLDNARVLKSLLRKIACPEELCDLEILLACLDSLSADDKRPLFAF